MVALFLLDREKKKKVGVEGKREAPSHMNIADVHWG
jgi:hypothetical protein